MDSDMVLIIKACESAWLQVASLATQGSMAPKATLPTDANVDPGGSLDCQPLYRMSVIRATDIQDQALGNCPGPDITWDLGG